MSSTVPTFGEKVFFRYAGLVLLFVPTFVNFILAIGEYNQPEETPVVFVAWTASLLVFLTVSLCVILATSEAFSVRVQLVGMTAACFSGAGPSHEPFHSTSHVPITHLQSDSRSLSTGGSWD